MSCKAIPEVKDMLLLPINGYVKIGKSGIHAEGLFSARFIVKGTNLGPALFCYKLWEEYAEYIVRDHGKNYKEIPVEKDFKQIIGARYINHSPPGNVALLLPEPNGTIEMIATKDIETGTEFSGDARLFFHFLSLEFPKYMK